MNFKINGLDALQRHLVEMKNAFAELDGDIGTVAFDPHDSASVEEAICQMERLIDEKTRPYSTNPTVMGVRDELKQKYALQIRERAKILASEGHEVEPEIDVPSAIARRDEHEIPRVFLSHSSADKPRIVLRLDEMLRARGIPVWLDERDLLPGRDLVKEIFTSGISGSGAFLIVLSKNSINSNWVREELSVATVQRINGVIKTIIPVVIDGVTVPDVLAATVWEVIPDIEQLEKHVDRIVSAVIGASPAPLGPAPEYAGIPVHQLAGLTPDDERVFSMSCKQILAHPTNYPIVSLERIREEAIASGMSLDSARESIAALEQRHYFTQVIHGLGEIDPAATRISTHGFELYLIHYLPREYRQQKIAILSAIVNSNAHHSTRIAQELDIHEYIVDHVLTQLENSGHIIASHSTSGIHIIAQPTLPRLLTALQGERTPE